MKTVHKRLGCDRAGVGVPGHGTAAHLSRAPLAEGAAPSPSREKRPGCCDLPATSQCPCPPLSKPDGQPDATELVYSKWLQESWKLRDRK